MPFTVIGRPASPFPEPVVTAVTDAVSRVEGVAEAHFPQMFIASRMQAPEQTSIIVLGEGRNERAVIGEVLARIKQRLPDGPEFPVMPMTGGDALLRTVRGTGCEVFRSATERPAARPWWRFW